MTHKKILMLYAKYTLNYDVFIKTWIRFCQIPFMTVCESFYVSMTQIWFSLSVSVSQLAHRECFMKDTEFLKHTHTHLLLLQRWWKQNQAIGISRYRHTSNLITLWTVQSDTAKASGRSWRDTHSNQVWYKAKTKSTDLK